MSLKGFHLVFIAASLGVMAFMLYWLRMQQAMGRPHRALAVCASVTFVLAAYYLVWFLRKYRKLK